VYRLVLGLALLSLSSLAMAATPGSIGVVTELEGEVQLLRDNNFYEAGIGVEIFKTDAVVTASDGQVQFDMIDGTTLRLGSGTRLRFSEYELDEEGNVASVVVDVLSGWLRFAVAKLQDNSTYNIDTPTMTIGIRGTEGVAEADPGNSGLFLEEGNVTVIGVGAGAGAGTEPMEVDAGEYVQRPVGQILRREVMTERLQNSRIPPRMRLRMARRMHMIGSARSRPRRLRAAQAAELNEFLLENPDARNEVRRRLRKHRFKHHRLQQQRIKRMQRPRPRMNSN
jgi:hypothetical protein